MDAYIGKKYMMTHNENYSEYLQFIGIDKETRDVMLNVPIIFCLTRTSDGKYCFLVSTEFGELEYTFNLGEEFDEMRFDNGTINNTTLPVSPCGAGISWLIKLKKFGESFMKQDTPIGNYSGRAVITMDGNILTLIQRSATGKISKSVSEYQEDKLLITTTALGFKKTVKRYFKAVN